MKRIISSAFLLLFVLGAKAQQGVSIGLFSGINTAWIFNSQQTWGDETYSDYDYGKIKTQFGAELGYNFTSHIGLHTGFYNSQQGQNYYDDGMKLRREINSKYTQIPVLLKLIPGQGKTRFNLMVGPQFGILKSAHETVKDYDGNVITTTNAALIAEQTARGFTPSTLILAEKREMIERTERFNKNDLSLILGFGADIYLTEGLYLGIGLRANVGVKDINDANFKLYDKGTTNYEASMNLFGGATFSLKYIIPTTKSKTEE